MKDADKSWQRDVLLVLYQEVGKHLRAGGDLRERLATVFMTILAGAASGFAILETQTPEFISAITGAAFIIAVLLASYGEIVLWGVIAARVWHAEYVNCMILILAMIRSGTLEPSSNLVEPTLRHSYLPGASTSRTYLIIQIGILFAIGVGTHSAARIFSSSIWKVYSIGSLVAVISLLANALLTRKSLLRAEQRFWEDPARSWCFAGLREPGLLGQAVVTPSGDRSELKPLSEGNPSVATVKTGIVPAETENVAVRGSRNTAGLNSRLGLTDVD